jgi:uncharacterized protein DUF1707
MAAMTIFDEIQTGIRQHADRGQVMDDGIRASDADRDRVTAQLRDHFAAGRITPSELDERLSAALSAKTLGDLRRIMADLPGPGPAPLGTAPLPLRATPAWAVRRRPPFPPLLLFALLAVALIPSTGWLLAAFLNVILLFWLMRFVIGVLAFGRSRRRWHHHGGWQRTRGPSGRHYTWL